MFTKTTPFAVAAVAVMLFAQPHGANADTRSIKEIDVCMQSLKDTLATRDANPAIGEKATAEFEKLVAAAQAKCQGGSTEEALLILVEARGIVASE